MGILVVGYEALWRRRDIEWRFIQTLNLPASPQTMFVIADADAQVSSWNSAPACARRSLNRLTRKGGLDLQKSLPSSHLPFGRGCVWEEPCNRA
jgi:hypothetical protein